ncbi:hypothetical protein ACEPAF_7067 [Sanghuangporus sanghuang]
MFLARCFRQGRGVILSSGSATFRRFASSSDRNLSLLPQIVVGRASYYIEHWAPHAILGYFKSTVLRDGVPKPVRLKTGEALLNMLFRKRFFDEAFQILDVMRGLRKEFSAPIRAKLLTVNFIHSGVRTGTYFHNLESLLRNPDFSGREDVDRHFLDVLHLLVYPGSPMDRLEKVVKLYLDVRGKDYRLDSSAIAVMIACHLARGNEADAERWLDYHSKRPSPSRSEVDPTFCLPYIAYAQKRLVASPDKDPQEVYGPILDRMFQDQAWPDSVFVNILITAELEHNNFHRVLGLYEMLRAHASRGVYPDETTYSRLFTAAAAVISAPGISESSKQRRALFPKSRRLLFREMAEMQLHLKHGHFTPLAPIISGVSLEAALQMFITCKDYAAAIVVLKVFELLHMPLEQRAMNIVITSIVSRCRKEIGSNSEDAAQKPSWADIFLDLRGIPRRRIKHVSDWDMRRRVISIARRTLAIAEARATEILDEGGENDSKVLKESQNDLKSGSSHQAESRANISEDREEADDESLDDLFDEESSSSTVRGQKKERMRERRFQVIDVLLSRALETSIVLQYRHAPERPALEALRNAFKAMLPDEKEATRKALARKFYDADDLPLNILHIFV